MPRGEVKTEVQLQFEQRVLGRIGNQALRTDIVAAEASDYPESDGYERMARGFYDAFIDAAAKQGETAEGDDKLLIDGLEDWGTPHHGYKVMARIIGHSARAYAVLCKETGRDASIEELVDMLMTESNYDTLIEGLASLPKDFAHARERAFSLFNLEYSNASSSNRTSLVVRRAGEKLVIQPKEELRCEAAASCIDLVLADHAKTEHCPVKDALLPNLWKEMVGFSASDPTLFAADLGLTSQQG